MSSGAPDADLVSVIEQAVTEKLERLEARRFGQTTAPRKGPPEADTEMEPGHEPSPTSRHVPAAVRRAVHERDGDRCCYREALASHRGPRRRASESQAG